MQQLVGRNRPLPQLWYFPGTAKTMLILTSDAHWNNASTDYPQFFADLNTHQGQVTMYLSDRLVGGVLTGPVMPTLQTWQAQGHTFGIHPYRVERFDFDSRVQRLSTACFRARTRFRGQTRCGSIGIEWEGWTSAADIAAAHNIALDVSFAPWGAWLQKPDGTWPHGYMTGSGLPMKFVRTDGTLTSVYQQLTESGGRSAVYWRRGVLKA